MVGTSAEVNATEPRRVTLDRPFAYAIVDLTTSAPLFFGIVRSVA
jgi:serine protease inhibitor